MSSRTRGLHRGAVALSAVAVSSCLSLGIPLGEAARPTGALTVRGEAIDAVEPIELQPSACVSGEHRLFLGADFVDEAQGLIARLVIDPLGEPTLRVFPAAEPLQRGLVFARSECARFELELERTGWQINEIYALRVRLDVECGEGESESVVGSVSAEGCR
ncbi:MAG TPA: hypothetical protein VNB06_06235 [Thermoanaerobaculia bacterium]|nr:hypothetical protein [Thermoanaerobaculia bacterium]